MTAGAAHRQLRTATDLQHRRLERRMDIARRIGSLEGRRTLVQAFHALHAAAEAGLEPWLAGTPGLDFEARRRSEWLARDLAELGAAPARCAPVVVRSLGEALGRMYVLEGSSLGGKVIRRQVERSGGRGMAGLSFLDPYGDRVGERWRSFLAVLDRDLCSPASVAEAVAGARAGFGDAERVLCGEALVG